MGRRGGRAGLLLAALLALVPASAAAQPGSGPRESINEGLTTARPGASTGVSWYARYHGAGNPRKNPPYLYRMTYHAPAGFRYDTSVPARCTASDVELQSQGPSACPKGSRLGGGRAWGIFFVPFAQPVVFDRYTHHLDIMNGAHQQIVLVHSEGWTVVRGDIRPDGSIAYTPTTCFPAPPSGKCANDYIMQLGSQTALHPYAKRSGGRTRRYATTPPTCPSRGYWVTRVEFWWSDGTHDNVASHEPCHSARS